MKGGQGRNFGLDLLRCVAIAVVLANHAFIGFFVEAADVAWVGRRSWWSINALVSVEWLFVLSGFLIGAMMVRGFERPGTGWSRARSFWLRRWFRTLPNYYLFLLVNILIVATGVRDGRFAGHWSWRHFVFMQNLWDGPTYPIFYPEAWSLAVDEWFYLVMPVLVLLALGTAAMRGRNKEAFFAATAALILVPTALRWLMPPPANFFFWDYDVRRVAILHLDATGWGVLAAVTSRWAPSFWRERVGAKALAGAALTAFALWVVPQPYLGGWAFEHFPRATYALPLTLFSLGAFLAFPWIAALPAPHALWRRGVEHVSNYTYSLYLAHIPVLLVVVFLMGTHLSVRQGWLGVAAWLPATFLVSMAVYHAFEKPVSDLRERFTSRVPAHPFGQPPAATSTAAAEAAKAAPARQD